MAISKRGRERDLISALYSKSVHHLFRKLPSGKRKKNGRIPSSPFLRKSNKKNNTEERVQPWEHHKPEFSYIKTPIRHPTRFGFLEPLSPPSTSVNPSQAKMARLFCIPASILLFAAFILNVIVTISLPYLPALDITRTRFPNGAEEDGRSLTELRVSIPLFFSFFVVPRGNSFLSCSWVSGVPKRRWSFFLSDLNVQDAVYL